MEWTKTIVETTSNGVETVTALLMQCGISSVEIIDAHERARYFADSTRTWDYADEKLMIADDTNAYVIFYVPTNADGDSQIDKVKHAISQICISDFDIGTLQISQEHTNDEAWLNEWKKHFKPLRIGRVVVVPEWETFEAENTDDILFRIDPGTAFGTGQHQTTQLCLHAIQKWVIAGDVVADIGCGSGILAITSMLLGASECYAIDVDPAGAIAATKRNASLNPINADKLTIHSGDLLTDENIREHIGYKKYDVVIANIVADVIIPLACIAPKLSKHNGLFVTSGIISERVNDVLETFKANNITVIEVTELDGWHSIVGRVSHA